jgi:hypothetical protein
MPRTSAERWLSERTRTGLREMPSNAAWLLSRLLQPAEAVGPQPSRLRRALAIEGGG